MTAGAKSSILLALDLTGTGHFSQLGLMNAPSPDFAAALTAYLADYEPECRDLALYRASSLTAGHCVWNEPQSAATLSACFEARLVTEWRLEISEAGVIQALFVIKRFQETQGTPWHFDLTLMLSGKPSFQEVNPERFEAG